MLSEILILARSQCIALVVQHSRKTRSYGEKDEFKAHWAFNDPRVHVFNLAANRGMRFHKDLKLYFTLNWP